MATLGEELVQREHNETFCVGIGPDYVETGKQISNRSGMQYLLAVPSDEPFRFQEKHKSLICH